MTQVKHIGRFCQTDDHGFIMNDSSTANINNEFQQVVDAVLETYRLYLGNELHSVYVRGSVPRGLGIVNVSDIDTIAILNKRVEDIDLGWRDKVEQELNDKYKCVKGVELSFYYIDDILQTNRFSIIPFMIKTHSICVYGDDLSVRLPHYKADKTLGNEHLFHLKDQITLAKKDLYDNEDRNDILDCCGWIMKIIVRAGLALVIEEENKYTRDLFPAYQSFSHYYPDHEPEMKQAVQYAIDPISDTYKIMRFLNQFGDWMINEAEKWLQIHNPKKIAKMEIEQIAK
ncbi:nucleotidyltransferase [Priestia koreensis]|uniref:nucleotidyltransferase n=1 Tax=Priestia koreensis TaxID=284581 RepID=UPI00301997CE